ncbi:hypothetical protein ACFQ0B_66125 [Nonomuraea thailandensis]
MRAGITLTDGLTATISHGELKGGALDAWCEEAGDYLEFPSPRSSRSGAPIEAVLLERPYLSGWAFFRFATSSSRKVAYPW